MNQVVKRRVVGAGVLVTALLVLGLVFFRGDGEPGGTPVQPSDLADVRSYAIEVPAIPEQPPQEILAGDPPIGTLLPVPAAEADAPAQPDKPKVKPKSSKAAASKPDRPADMSPVVPDVGWSVQVGSFASRDNADRLLKRLKDKGFPAFVYRNAAENPPLFRVRVGPFVQQAEAKANAQRLREELRLDVRVVANG
jgi:DedD protein